MKCRLPIVLAIAFLLSGNAAAASDDASLQICIAPAADYSAIYPTQNIPASLRQVSAVFHFAKGESHDVTGVWYAVAVGKAAPPNYRLAATTMHNLSKGRFLLTLPRAFPLGRYRLDVAVDGKPWKSAAFNMVADLPVPQVAQPEDLIPAKPGRTWTYDFMQQAGNGAKIDLPDIKPDAEGRYRATVLMSVAGVDVLGKHVELRRNGKLVFEEWWRFNSNGLVATKRRSGDTELVLNPPQVMWPWPLRTSSSWTYTPRDHAYEETFKMWGPLPVATPTGEKPGYLVLADQRSSPFHLTAEREFVPGLGLVREVDVTAVNDEMVSRQETVLRH